jgi:hypothetical protein
MVIILSQHATRSTRLPPRYSGKLTLTDYHYHYFHHHALTRWYYILGDPFQSLLAAASYQSLTVLPCLLYLE